MDKPVAAAKKLWKRNVFKTIVAIALIVGIVAGSHFTLQLALDTPYPALPVETGSMCIPSGRNCDGWSHAFEPTLHMGDLLLVQGVKPEELNANYPYSDIIVFRNPSDNKFIVHRIVSAQTINGTMYFRTKGDANGPILWPNLPNYYDDIPDLKGVPQDLVVGKVVVRIPWVGWIILFLQNNPYSVPLVIALALSLAIVEFVSTRAKAKRKRPAQQNDAHASS